jgi:protein O-GlcNAc transferase
MTDARDWLRRGLDLHRAGSLEAAAEAYQRAIDLADLSDAWHMLGMLRHQLGDSADALRCLQQALDRQPGNAAILANRAVVLLAGDDFEGARRDAERASTLNPDSYAAWFNLAQALDGMDRHGQALQALLQAQRLRPDADIAGQVLRAKFRHGRELSLGGQPSAALAVWNDYFDDGGNDPDAHLLRANVLSDLARHETARSDYQAACAQAPDNPDYASAALIASCFQPETDGLQQHALAQSWAARFCAGHALRSLSTRHTGSRRIGFYSPRFAAGPMASLVLPLLHELRALGVELHLYSGFDYNDAQTPRFRALAPHWRDVQALDDAALVQCLRADELDVLVDLCGHAPGNRLRAFAARMATLQVSWGDWFASTGVPAMDLFLSDPVLSPHGDEAAFSERLLRLPHTRFAYAPPQAWQEIPQRRAANLRGPRFASFNRLSKLTDATLACWAELLAQLPAARLHLQAAALDELATLAYTRQRFVDCGIAAERIHARGFSSYAETLAHYGEIDIALDPFPFNGCVTSFDALWMGVPVVALRGRTLVGRQSAALLHAHGCADWVAEQPDQYVEIALSLAEPAALHAARERLLGARTDSPLFDIHSFARDWLAAVESALQN